MFFALWVFTLLEIYAPNTVVFAAECVFFLLIYGLTLFDIPLIIPTLFMISGCVAKGIINMQLEGAREMDFLFPVTYLLAFLFYFEQLYRTKCEGKTVMGEILGWSFRVISVALLGFSIYYIIEKGVKVSRSHAYSIFIFAAIGLICLALALLPTEKAQKNKKSKKRKNSRQQEESRMTYAPMRMSFVFVPVCVIGSCLLFIKIFEYSLVHAVPFLWALNLIMLIRYGHPLLSAHYENLRSKIDSRLNK